MRATVLLLNYCCYAIAKDAQAHFYGPSIRGNILFTDEAEGTLFTINLQLEGNASSVNHSIRLHSRPVGDDFNSSISTRCLLTGDIELFNGTVGDWNTMMVDLSSSTTVRRIKGLSVAQVLWKSVVVYSAQNQTERLGCADIRPRPPLAEIPSADWWPSLWILLGICIACILFERCYNSCRKVVRRRQGRSVEGFSPVPVTGFEHSKDSYNDQPAAFEIEMAEDDVLTSDEEDTAGRTKRGQD